MRVGRRGKSEFGADQVGKSDVPRCVALVFVSSPYVDAERARAHDAAAARGWGMGWDRVVYRARVEDAGESVDAPRVTAETAT